MRSLAIVLAALLAVARAGVFIQDGKEYVFNTQAAVFAGTMDHAAHSAGLAVTMKTRMQVAGGGKTLNVKFENMKMGEYVGPHDTKTWPFDDLSYKNADMPNPPAFSVKLNGDGLFESMTLPDAPIRQQNIMKAWAAMLQINTKKIKGGEKSFISEEQQVEGTCDVTYVVSDQAVRKSINHMSDCHNLVYRMVDDMRGRQCGNKVHRHEREHEGHEGHEEGEHGSRPPLNYPASLTNTVFLVDRDGSKFKLKGIISTGTFVAEFYGDKGSTQLIHTNSTSKLVNMKSSSGDISASGSTITDLRYTWDDAKYGWDKSRDLKAVEPFFSSGMYFNNEGNMAGIVSKLKERINANKDMLENLETDSQSIMKAHRQGVQTIFPALYALDYNSLKSLAEDLMADKSDTGTIKAKIFTELLGSVGTSAAAMVVRDLVMENKFDNDRDAALALTKVPFHIRRPNKQLVEEYEKLLNRDNGRFTEMAVPLVFAHLVRITCERAGKGYGKDPEKMECFKTFGAKYVNKFWDQYKNSNDHQEKAMMLAVLTNIRYGGQSKLLKPLIDGKMDQCPQLRSMAMWTAGWEAVASGKGFEYYSPLFADRSLTSEMRIAALEMMMYSRPNAAQMASIVTVLYGDKDYEVINYAYALFQRYGDSIDPCDQEISKLSSHFLKFMRQFSQYETDWSFGVSKTYQRQFHKKKYGYSGAYMFYVVGSQKSTMPISIGASMSSTRSNNYKIQVGSVHIRMEGLSKALLRKFRKIDPATWKTADLKSILSGDMAIRERPDQPVRVQVSVWIKGSIVAHRMYDESDGTKDGKIASFVNEIKDMGDTYSVNYGRAIQLASGLYEQPTNLGIPFAVMSSMTAIGHIHATVKRGNHRGLLYRDISYNIHLFAQGNRMAFIPLTKTSYGIVNDRIYYAHIPRKIVAGVNPIKKELKLSVSRPEHNDPAKMIMHSVTFVLIRSNDVEGKYMGFKETCPQCTKPYSIVSRGPDSIQTKTIVDFENDKRGAKLYAEYFGCEMDISVKNRARNILAALMPYNKNPRTPYTSIVMGIRQIRAFLIFFPRTEQCGVMARWSQSQNNPIKEVEVTIRGNVEENGNRMFFRGRKWFIKALIKGKGEPADRSYRINFAYEFTPGYLKNKVKLQLSRAPVPALSISPYTVCFALENKYPEFSKEFFGYEENKDLSVSGKAMIQYGKGSSCTDTDGEIRVKFDHSTTQEARDQLKKKWYYKRCMESKNSAGWSSRKGWPITEACWMTLWDGTSARKYSWDVEIVKMSDRMKKITSSVRSALKAGLLPWDLDGPATIGADGEIGKNIKMVATLKNDESEADVTIETDKGKEEYNDVPLRLDWTKRLRNMKFTPTLKRLMDTRIINPCIATNSEIRSNDNVTYAYEASSCWTLYSATCGPTPSFAVFGRKGSGGSKLDTTIFIGGHKIEMSGSSVKVEGSPQSIADGEAYTKMQDGTEIFKIFRWGSTYNLYSFLKVWVAYDGTFLEVVPAPSTKGQHCGICGNYNRQQKDEFTGKDMSQISNVKEFVKNWEWKC